MKETKKKDPKEKESIKKPRKIKYQKK